MVIWILVPSLMAGVLAIFLAFLEANRMIFCPTVYRHKMNYCGQDFSKGRHLRGEVYAFHKIKHVWWVFYKKSRGNTEYLSDFSKFEDLKKPRRWL